MPAHVNLFLFFFVKLTDDIKSARLLHLKGWLFLAIALLSAALLILENPGLRTVLLCLALGWGAARFYYYLFYVLEKYTGRDRPYAGILDEIRHLLTPRK